MRERKIANKEAYKLIIPKMIIRIILGICFIIFWNKFVNVSTNYRLLEKGLFFVGIYLLVMAWFNYLRLDGIAFKRNKRKEKKESLKKGLGDYLEEEASKIEVDQEDQREDLLLTALANIGTALIFLIPAILLAYS